MAYDITKAFERIERELISSMVRNMKKHRVEEIDKDIQWTQWQVLQLQGLDEYKRKYSKKYKKQFRTINAQLEAALIAAREQGDMDAEIAILNALRKGWLAPNGGPKMDAQFFRLNERKMDALVRSVTHDMEKAEHAVMRFAEDQYRRIIFDAQVYANSGAGTYEKAVDMATDDFLSKGINCIQYANGARVGIAAYVDMAIRTASKRAYLMGEGAKRAEWGVHTVIMNKRTNACPKCMPFEGKVLIDDVWSGGSADEGPYPLMSSAIAAGLYHPNCKDIHTTYFPGVSTPPDDKFTKQELDDVEERERLENKKSYVKRQAEKCGRLADYSLDKEKQQKYRERESDWKRQIPGLNQAIKEIDGSKVFDIRDKVGFESDLDRFKRKKLFPKELKVKGDFTKEQYTKIRKQYIDIVKKKFEEGTDLGRKTFLRYSSKNVVTTLLEENVIRYENGKIYLNMFKDIDDPRGPATAFFHEIGHHIDDSLGWKFTKSNDLLNLLYEDIGNVDETWLLKVIKDNYKASSTSDIVGALTKSRITGRYGHDKMYWKESTSISSEFFAHFFEAQFDFERQAILEKAFPKSYNYLENELKKH